MSQIEARFDYAVAVAHESLLSGTAFHGPSRNLSWSELNCNDGTPYPTKWRDLRSQKLAMEFEIVRYILGAKPIKVGSAYRSPEHQARLLGTNPDAAKRSQHVQGHALDLWTPAHVEIDELLDAVLFVSKKRRLIRGVGIYPWGVHMDVRLTTRLKRWRSQRAAPELVEVLFNAEV